MESERLALVAGIALVVVLASVVALYWVPPSTPHSQTTEKVQLVIAWNASTGQYAYSNHSIRAPAGTILNLTIVNYDPMNHSAPWRYCNVTGTMDGMMQEFGNGSYAGRMGPGMMGWHDAPGYAPASVSHTFTMIGNGYDVNVPIPAAGSPTEPSVVSFSFQVHGAGELNWTCEAFGMDQGSGTSPGMMGGFNAY